MNKSNNNNSNNNDDNNNNHSNNNNNNNNIRFDSFSPNCAEICQIIKRRKTSGSPCPLD